MKKLKFLMQKSNHIRFHLSTRGHWWLLLLSLPLMMTFIGCEGDTITVAPPSEAVQGIQVTGSGSAYGEPDVAMLHLGVSTERDSVKEAREEAAVVMQRVVSSLKNNGVSEVDIQTQHFSIQPQYDYIDKRKVLRGYRVTNMVSVKIRTLDQTGKIIDDAAEAGGDIVQVQSIRFEIDDPTELQTQARVEAMKDAKARAETLAEESGVKLGKPISISESMKFPSPVRYGDYAEEAITTPIEPGQLEVTVTVTVIYEIE